jgi:natural resistance-associated macrophage protein 2
MAITFTVIFFISGPVWGDLFFGLFVPTVPAHATDSAIGLVGAVIMPHNLYLHSALVLSRKVDNKNPKAVYEANIYNTVESAFSLFISFIISVFVIGTFANYSNRPDA